MKNYFKMGSNMFILFILINVLFLSSCTTKWLRIHSDELPADSLRLAQVIAIHNRSEIDQLKQTYDEIITSGIPDSEIIDGSVIQANVLCCGGVTRNLSAEIANAKIVFVPQGIDVNLGDIIEVRSGTSGSENNLSKVNLVTRVVQKEDENKEHCWWDPKDERLWGRVLYCDWMPKEGWIKQGGLFPSWYKPAVPRGSR